MICVTINKQTVSPEQGEAVCLLCICEKQSDPVFLSLCIFG